MNTHQVSLSAIDPSGNTITGTGYISVVDATPPVITSSMFQPPASQREELQALGEVKFGCNNRGVLGCGRRDPAIRRAGVAVRVVDPATDPPASKPPPRRRKSTHGSAPVADPTITASDNHPCFSAPRSVQLETFPKLTAGQVAAMLDKIGAYKAQKDQAASVARDNAGCCTIQLWTATDPAGNIDRVAEVACVRRRTAVKRGPPGC